MQPEEVLSAAGAGIQLEDMVVAVYAITLEGSEFDLADTVRGSGLEEDSLAVASPGM
jgi:hypothetical protein